MTTMPVEAALPFGCPVCGQSLRTPGPCRNRWCGRTDRCFSVVHSVGAHSGALRRAVWRYKYREETWWAGVFASLIAGYLTDHDCWFEDIDVLTAVPAYTGPGARRNWDHMGEVATRLGSLLGVTWTVRCDVLSKRMETPCLRGRTEADRRRLAAGPLRRSLRVLDPGAVEGSRVLVVDDVLTEGSTLNEVARVLLAAGAVEVCGLVIARPEWSQPSGDQ